MRPLLPIIFIIIYIIYAFYIDALTRGPAGRAKRIRDLLRRVMRDGKAPADLGSMRAAAAVVPRIEKVGRLRRRLALGPQRP